MCMNRPLHRSVIEKGAPGLSMSCYLQVLFVPGQENDLLKVAADDPWGQKITGRWVYSIRRNRLGVGS